MSTETEHRYIVTVTDKDQGDRGVAGGPRFEISTTTTEDEAQGWIDDGLDVYQVPDPGEG